MVNNFSLEICTPQEAVYSGEAVSLVVPASRGYLGVLAHHAPLMTGLVPGKITVRESQEKTVAFRSMGSGVLEVRENKAVLLLDSVDK